VGRPSHSGCPCYPCEIMSAVLFAFISLPSSSLPRFVWELIRRAALETVHSSFGTTFTSILLGIAIFLFILWRVYSREGGFAAVLKHWQNGRDAIVAVIVVYLLTFLFHLFITIPGEIRKEARAISPPAVTIRYPLRLQVPSPAVLAADRRPSATIQS
jgi:hypothetical protein